MPITRTETGDIFTVPSNSILIHSCNALGAWGAGVALEFKRRFPQAFKTYNAHCLTTPPTSLLGTCLLIPAVGQPFNFPIDNNIYYIACLITSHRFGKRVDAPGLILGNTRLALRDLGRQLRELKGKEEVGECYAVRINSGGFKVEWEESRTVLEEWGVDVVIRDRDGGA